MSRAVSPHRLSRPAATLVDNILDEFSRHREATGTAATEVQIPRELEARLDSYYRKRGGRTAREMVPQWKGIRKVVWEAPAFLVC